MQPTGVLVRLDALVGLRPLRFTAMGFTKAQRGAQPRVPLPPNRPSATADPPAGVSSTSPSGAFAGRLASSCGADVARASPRTSACSAAATSARCRLGSRSTGSSRAALHGGDVDGDGAASSVARAPPAERARGWAAHEAGALTAAHAATAASARVRRSSAQRHPDGRHVVFGRCRPRPRARRAAGRGARDRGRRGRARARDRRARLRRLLAEWRAEGSGLIVATRRRARARRRWRSWRASAEPKVSFTLDEAEAGGGAPQSTRSGASRAAAKLALVQPRDGA